MTELRRNRILVRVGKADDGAGMLSWFPGDPSHPEVVNGSDQAPALDWGDGGDDEDLYDWEAPDCSLEEALAAMRLPEKTAGPTVLRLPEKLPAPVVSEGVEPSTMVADW